MPDTVEKVILTGLSLTGFCQFLIKRYDSAATSSSSDPSLDELLYRLPPAHAYLTHSWYGLLSPENKVFPMYPECRRILYVNWLYCKER